MKNVITMLWVKHMGLKRSVISNTLEEHMENLKKTYWEQNKNDKNLPPLKT